MKIYTTKGDDGFTGLFGGGRVAKHHFRVDSYGQVDELNSVLGLVASLEIGDAMKKSLVRIQSELFDLGAELATEPSARQASTVAKIDDDQVSTMEKEIDHMEAQLKPLTTFILPGGSVEASHLHVARTSCRRAERAVVALSHQDTVRGELIRYLNRLSDLLFVMARFENHRRAIPDVPWMGRHTTPTEP